MPFEIPESVVDIRLPRSVTIARRVFPPPSPPVNIKTGRACPALRQTQSNSVDRALILTSRRVWASPRAGALNKRPTHLVARLLAALDIGAGVRDTGAHVRGLDVDHLVKLPCRHENLASALLDPPGLDTQGPGRDRGMLPEIEPRRHAARSGKDGEQPAAPLVLPDKHEIVGSRGEQARRGHAHPGPRCRVSRPEPPRSEPCARTCFPRPRPHARGPGPGAARARLRRRFRAGLDL